MKSILNLLQWISSRRLGALAAALAIVFLSGATRMESAPPALKYTLLTTFKGSMGAAPYGGLTLDTKGNLYGTTALGGTDYDGVVFKLSSTAKESLLYSFTDGIDGGFPYAGVVRDGAGNLYGTTANGGSNNDGVVFKVTSSGVESVLYSFTGGIDGEFPEGGVVRDPSGNLYGTAEAAGNFGYGVVFKVDTSNNETVLYSFTGGTDGASSYSGLIRDSLGNLYGTTKDGGNPNCAFPFGGCGVVFKVDTSGNETVLYAFQGGSDGAYPVASLIMDSSGNLYGSTSDGGDVSCNHPNGYGTIFKVDTSNNETVLYSFTGGTDGAYPLAGLVRDAVGNLYGTTYGGGKASCDSFQLGCGVVFKLNAAGHETVLHIFMGRTDGANPESPLVRDGSGNLYGTAGAGGTAGDGVVFKISN